MSLEAGVEARRPRPVSAGLWTLFSWLRRDERSSTESVSSAGSDRTVASFAFISPAHYRPTASVEPTALPPLGPPTDTYKKRIHERNLRHQREHDLTLHRKYGLFKGDSTSRYKTFSSPSARTGKGEAYDKLNRERRASSESGQRRSAYVVGKRRAPPPPVYAAATTSLNRRTRKRPAPQPPMNTNDTKLKNPMTAKSASGSNNFENTENCLDCKYEKYSKVDVSKECKSRTEKNFLKQIFESKKGKSPVISPLGRLPNISELDREAAEIIRMRRDHSVLNSNSMFKGDSWFCTTCLRKYDPSIVSCLHCVEDVKFTNKTKDENESSNVPSASNQGSDRQQLKKMLKEMKDSIPKKSKLNDHASRTVKNVVDQQNTNFIGSDTPTLQMQCSKKANDEKKSVGNQLSPKIHRDPENRNVNFINNNILVTQTVVIQSPPNNMREINCKGPTFNDLPKIVTLLEDNVRAPDALKDTNFGERDYERKFVSDTKQMNKTHLNSPMRISSLLNPVSIPGSNDKYKTKLVPLTYDNSQNYIIKETEPMNRDVKNAEDKRVNIADILQTNKNIKNKTTSLLEKTPQNPVIKETISINKNLKNLEKKFNTANNSQSNLNVTKEIESNRDVKHVDKTVNTLDVSQLNNSDLENKIKLKPSLPSNPQNNIIKEYDSINRDVKNVAETVNIAHVSQTKSGLRNQIIMESSINHDGTSSMNKDVKDFEFVLQANSHTRNQIALKTSLPSTSKAVDISQRKPTESFLAPKGTADFLSSDTSKEAPVKSPSENKEQITQAVLVPKNEKMKNPLEDALAKPSSMDSGLPKPKNYNMNMAPLEQHSKRRELINILEKSIAKGDERSAADAAAKLAQLRLSCSVLSFSSNIVRENTVPSSVTNPNNTNTPQTDKAPINANVIGKSPAKIDTGTQSIATCAPVENKQNHAKTVLTKPIACEKNPIKKATCSDDSKPSTSRQGHENKSVTIKVWVEDRVAARGPVLLQLPQHAVMGELRRVAETTLGLASRLQRWIVGRALCTDDNAPLTSLAGPELSLPFYLCLVESDSSKTSHHTQESASNPDHPVDVGAVYTELMQLEQRSIITNAEAFECAICMDNCAEGDGVVLRDCVHSFCMNCLADVVRHSGEPVVSCPASDCSGTVQEREVRALVPPAEYERWLARGLAAAESGARHAFHCRTPDCAGWALCEPGVRRFPCPLCKHINCVPCQAIHESETCEGHRAKLKEAERAIEAGETDDGTRRLFESLISKGEALECPECRAMITKKWGCDWVKCFACKTEICWVTRGRRWGPGGRGDTSGGCRCGVDGKRCHPSCGYCH